MIDKISRNKKAVAVIFTIPQSLQTSPDPAIGRGISANIPCLSAHIAG
ncbi:MAG: hypothetical protein PHH68_08180 [Candidatus Omnitrophica bacterium]|nr:hypothetical protein [Candidatus Omnitrophota bacterium]MDD5080276.1 hypothetical protein [Candidatus Omnitrophota bacterium]